MCKLRPLLKEWLQDAEAALANGASLNELLDRLIIRENSTNNFNKLKRDKCSKWWTYFKLSIAQLDAIPFCYIARWKSGFSHRTTAVWTSHQTTTEADEFGHEPESRARRLLLGEPSTGSRTNDWDSEFARIGQGCEWACLVFCNAFMTQSSGRASLVLQSATKSPSSRWSRRAGNRRQQLTLLL